MRICHFLCAILMRSFYILNPHIIIRNMKIVSQEVWSIFSWSFGPLSSFPFSLFHTLRRVGRRRQRICKSTMGAQRRGGPAAAFSISWLTNLKLARPASPSPPPPASFIGGRIFGAAVSQPIHIPVSFGFGYGHLLVSFFAHWQSQI